MIAIAACVANMLTAVASSSAITLGYRPFIDPLPIDDFWLALLLPLVLAIAVVYKTIKLDDLSRLASQSAYLAAQIVAFMIIAAGVLWLLNTLI